MAADSLPDLPPSAAWWLAAVFAVAWLALRVTILRRREARREPGEPEVPAWPWLRALARARWADLLLVALGLAAAAGLLASLGVLRA